jgi:hypothetical protein
MKSRYFCGYFCSSGCGLKGCAEVITGAACIVFALIHSTPERGIDGLLNAVKQYSSPAADRI